MQNVDELCIKYVLNELDPSEVLVVEQAMRDDANVLIEIESLRCTLRKLNKLPEYNPPTEVQDKVLALAKQHAEMKERRFGAHWHMNGLYAIAAVLVLGIGFGFYQFNINSDPDVNAAVGVMSATETVEQVQSAPESAATTVDPWVDRQNVLHINITSGPEGFGILSGNAASGNAQQLQRIDPQVPNQPSYPVMRDIHLTRTQP